MAEEKIHAAISAIMGQMGAIKKEKENTQGFRFKYRGIDDVYNELHALLAEHGVYTVPEVLPETMAATEVTSKSGGVIFNKACAIRYHFYAADGSSVTATVIGSAMDSGDKAWNKAMSVAHKYAFVQVFAIATDDIADPDATTHEVVTKQSITEPAAMKKRLAQVTKLLDDNMDILVPACITSTKADLENAKTVPDLRTIWDDLNATIDSLRKAERKATVDERPVTVDDAKDARRAALDETIAELKKDVEGAEPDDEADKDADGQPLF